MTQETISAAELRRRLGQPPPGADRQKPARQKPVQHEFALQEASAQWLEALEWPDQVPPCWTHPANERASVLGAILAKRCGQRAGVADWIFWLAGGRTLAIELKVGDGRPSEAQKEFRLQLEALGHPWRLARSIEEMAAAMREAGLEFRETPKARGIREAF